MISLSLLKKLFISSYEDFKTNKNLFLKTFIVLVIINICEAFPWELTGEQNSAPEILFNIVIGVITLIISVDVINSQVAIIKQQGKERLLYTVPSFFIAQILYILISLFGLALFIIPGLLAFVFFGFAPLLTIVEPENFSTSFKRSFHLVKKDFLTVAIFNIVILALELVPALIALIPGWQLRAILLIALSYPLALLSFLFMQAMVKLYFYLVQKESSPT